MAKQCVDEKVRAAVVEIADKVGLLAGKYAKLESRLDEVEVKQASEVLPPGRHRVCEYVDVPDIPDNPPAQKQEVLLCTRHPSKLMEPFAVEGVKPWFNMTEWLFDPQHEGLWTTPHNKICNWIQSCVPNGFDGIVAIDWEQEGIYILKAGPDHPGWKQTFTDYRKLLKYVKELRPYAKVGYWGLPFDRYSNYGVDRQASLDAIRPLMDEVDVLLPDCYITATVADNMVRKRGRVAQALSDYAKPVYPCVWARDKVTRELMDHKTLREYLEFALLPYGGNSIPDGLLIWDITHRWLKTGAFPQVIASEKLTTETADEYLARLEYYVSATAMDVVNGVDVVRPFVRPGKWHKVPVQIKSTAPTPEYVSFKKGRDVSRPSIGSKQDG